MHSVRPRRWNDWSVPHRPMYLRVDPLLAKVVADVVRGLEVADLCLLYVSDVHILSYICFRVLVV